MEPMYLKSDKEFLELDYKAILMDRVKKLKKINNDLRLQAALKKFYQTHPIHFIEDWISTHNPMEQRTVPFILFNRQRDYINWLYDRLRKQEDGLVEKCREVGITHLSVAFAIWMFLFMPDTSVGFCSQKIDRADKIGDPDSILEKGRMMLRQIPRFLLPDEFDVGKHCRYCLFQNPRNNSIIKAEGGSNIGRGGRTTIFFKDESAFYEHPEQIDAALSQTSRCKIDMSTINKIGSPFYEKRFSGRIPVFEFDYRDDPRKGEEWREEQLKRLHKVIVQKEIDRNWEANDGQVCIPNEWVKAAVLEDMDKSEFANEPIYAGLDISEGKERDRNAMVIRQGPNVLHVESWDTGTTHYTANRAFSICQQYGVSYLNYDAIGIGGGLIGEFNNLRERSPEFDIEISDIKINRADDITKNNHLGVLFRDLKAYLWFVVRDRFEKTYEYNKGSGKKYGKNDMIFIPNELELIKELSIPRYDYTNTGYVCIESKKNLKGVKSHDLADAFMLAFHSPFRSVTFDVY